jgi:hypothetical protein
MTAAFVLFKNVNLATEFFVGMDGVGFCKNLTTSNISSLYGTEKCTDVIACFTVVEDFVEHLNTGNNSFLFLFGKTNDFNFVAGMDLATFYTAGNNGTTTSDGEDVFDRHKEGKVCFTFRSGDVAVNSVHEVCDRFVNRVRRIHGGVFKNLERRTSDYRNVITGIFILGKEFTNFHFYEFEHFFVAAELVNFVEEYYDVGNTYLTERRMCSRVWGMGPSAAETTRMVPSICAAPVIMFLI